MSIVIVITNQKGGVGKTTTAINLSYYLAHSGHNTLLVDFDPQGNATSGLGIKKDGLEGTMSDVIEGKTTIDQIVQASCCENLWVAPSTSILANTEVELAQADKRFTRLKSAINKITRPFEFIIIDSPPSLSLLTVNGLIAANYVLLPVQAEFYALEGLGQLLETMKLIKKASNPSLDLLGVLATMMDTRTTLSNQVYEEIKKYFPDKVFKTTIPRNIRLAEAPSHGVPIGLYDRFSKGAKSYKLLAKEVMERVK